MWSCLWGKGKDDILHWPCMLHNVQNIFLRKIGGFLSFLPEGAKIN